MEDARRAFTAEGTLERTDDRVIRASRQVFAAVLTLIFHFEQRVLPHDRLANDRRPKNKVGGCPQV